MNINIAFNTIIYIMVFLFPGILFRRAFFSGKFNNHFDKGNSFERILWCILLSLIGIAFFFIIVDFINYIFPNTISFKLNKDEVLNSFVSIYENTFPDTLKNYHSLISISKVLLSLYIFCIIIGFSINKIIFYLGLQKRFELLNFQNKWDLITNSTKTNNPNHNVGDLHYTDIDVKTDSEELFTGKLHDIIYDKDNKIDTIIIKDAYKFYRLNKENDSKKIEKIQEKIDKNDENLIFHIESNTEFIYKKRIKGNLFTISNTKVENISITYIKISDLYESFQKNIKKIVSITLLISVAFCGSYLIWDYNIFSFINYIRRLAFCLLTPVITVFFLLFIVSILNMIFSKQTKDHVTKMKDTIVLLIFFSIPYLYIFDILGKWKVAIIFLIAFMNVNRLLSNDNKNA